MAIPSPATQQERRRRNKAYPRESIGRPTSARTSVFLEAICSRNGRKIYTKFRQRIIQAYYFFNSSAIIVSVAKGTTGIRPDDALSAYNGGNLNFPWPTENLNFRTQHAHAQPTNFPSPTENLNFAPRMRMLNQRPSPLKPSVSAFNPVPFSQLFVSLKFTFASLSLDGYCPCTALPSHFCLMLSSACDFACYLS